MESRHDTKKKDHKKDKEEEPTLVLDMFWEDDDTLVQGDDYYSQQPLKFKSLSSKPKMPVQYGDAKILNDIDLSKRSSCGVSKCFWPSVSDPDNVGYLVTNEGEADALYYAFDVAKDIAENCGVRHTFAPHTPVVLIEVSVAWMTNLARMVFNPSRVAVGQRSPQVFHPHDTVVAVQKVICAPSPNLLYGTGGTKWPYMVAEMEKFRDQVVVSRAELKARLHKEAEHLKCVFTRYPTYWLDFQGIVDTKGNFYHMDIDQNYWNEHHLRAVNLQKQEKCLDDFYLMVQGLTDPVFNATLLLARDGDHDDDDDDD